MSVELEDSLSSLRWRARPVNDFSAAEFLRLARLRVDVFVVEQTCVYPEFDCFDAMQSTLHITGDRVDGTDVQTLACARVMFAEDPAGVSIADDQSPSVPDQYPVFARIGRVAVKQELRGVGVASNLMEFVLAEIKNRADSRQGYLATAASKSQIQQPMSRDTFCVTLSSQTYVVPFYASLGFVTCSNPYLEDGIEHVLSLIHI